MERDLTFNKFYINIYLYSLDLNADFKHDIKHCGDLLSSDLDKTLICSSFIFITVEKKQPRYRRY